MMGRVAAALTASLLAWLVADGAQAATCGTGPGGFQAWLAAYQRESVAAGIPQAVASAALGGLSYDAGVIRLDRRQGYFKQSFERYRATRATPAKIAAAKARLRQNAALFHSIEQRFGVPGPVLAAIWGLETDFGAGTGTTPVLRSLATLAYDCRRSAFFTNELTNALRIVARGDLAPASMRGGWAGELGQTQFLPSSYVKFAVDFDGDGRRDLIRSSADALASTANYLKGYGWRAGQPYGEGTANFQVLRQWNKAEVYCRTIAWLAAEIAR